MSILNKKKQISDLIFSDIKSILSVDTKYSGDPSPSCWNWNRFGSGSRNLGDLLFLMNEESVWKSSALHPPPEYMIQQESHKGRLIETSGCSPFKNSCLGSSYHPYIVF